MMRTQRAKIRIQCWQQLLENSPELGFLFARQQRTFIGATEEMPYFVQRTSRRANKPLVIRRGRSAITFRDICTDAVGRTHQLVTDRASRERMPRDYDRPNKVGKLLGKAVDAEFIESEACHVRSKHRENDDANCFLP